MRKQVIVHVSVEFLQGMLTKGWRAGYPQNTGLECTEGLPDGAKYMRCFYDFTRDVVGMVFEHESFAEVGDGAMPPEFKPQFRQLRGEQ